MIRAGLIGMSGALLVLGASLGARAVASQTPAAAQSAPAAATVDVAACQACHGTNGISRSPRIPNLAGQQPDYLVAQLQAFRSGTRKNDLMEAIAAQLSDADIAALAQYWSSRPPGGGDVHGDGAAAGPAIPSRMSFPADFPTGFTLYESVNAEGSVAERYANGPAIAAARAGRPLPAGSVILVVNRTAAGAAPTSYAAMESRAGWGAAIPALLRNGDWDYALFDGRRVRNDRLSQAQCLACHKPREASSFVFTLPALRERAARTGG